MLPFPFTEPISEHLWRTRYRWVDDGRMVEPSIEATWDRVALAVSGAEPHHHDAWRERFRALLHDFRFLPGGRTLAGAGTTRSETLFDCLVIGAVADSTHGILDALHELVATLRAGGAAGVDLSTLRPAESAGAAPAGPVWFMSVWETSSAIWNPGSMRRGAVMATLRCDHPDIESFVDAKSAAGALPHFNLSVMLSDEFMRAVEADDPWPLVFPLGAQPAPPGYEVCERVWADGPAPQPCLVRKRIPARALLDRIARAAHAGANPGALFIDRINAANNLWYGERLSDADPHAGVLLPPHGACNLGSINLTRFVHHPFARHPSVDFDGLRAMAAVATRFLDDVHDISSFPLSAQKTAAQFSRRIGLGVTGLADMFLMLGLQYGSEASITLTHEIMIAIRDAAYRTSIEIAREKGPFPGFDKIRYSASPFVLGLPREMQDAIWQHGIRNSHLLAVTPAASASLLANNVSGGIQPIPAFRAMRHTADDDGRLEPFTVEDAAWREYKVLHGRNPSLPAHFVQALNAGPEEQLRMTEAVQSCVDNAISATVRLRESATPEEVGAILRHAWALGLMGCAVRREGSTGGEAPDVLQSKGSVAQAASA